MTNPYRKWPACAFRFGGGGGTAPTVPNATPPPTANNSASLAVEQATFRQQLRRKSILNTVTPQGGAAPYIPGAGSAPLSPGAGSPK
jgi:hypothetical protein